MIERYGIGKGLWGQIKVFNNKLERARTHGKITTQVGKNYAQIKRKPIQVEINGIPKGKNPAPIKKKNPHK